jgi:hypothetical protein
LGKTTVEVCPAAIDAVISCVAVLYEPPLRPIAIFDIGVELAFVTTKYALLFFPTAIAPDVPFIEVLTVSFTVIVWLPVDFNFAEKVPVPLVSIEFAGSFAFLSVLLKWIVPAYPVAWLLNLSSAVTVNVKATPAVTNEGGDTEKWVAAAGLTVMVPEIPVIEAVAVSAAAIVWFPALFNFAVNMPVPLVRVASAGNIAAGSLLVKCTVPE